MEKRRGIGKKDSWITIYSERGSSYRDTTSVMLIPGLGVLARVSLLCREGVTESIAFIPGASIIQNDAGHFEIGLKTSD